MEKENGKGKDKKYTYTGHTGRGEGTTHSYVGEVQVYSSAPTEGAL